jgi:hypothetical protein
MNFGGRKIRESARSLFRKSRTGNSRTSEKQSQSCRPKKSGFGVWTSGKLVNIWDEKDILVCVHIRSILRARGCFQNVKVPSSPYKRGREGTCKWIHNFRNLSILAEILSLLSRHCCAWTCTPLVLSLVFGEPIRIFGYPQQSHDRNCLCITLSIMSI